MSQAAKRWARRLLVLAALAGAGCESSRAVRPPRLVRSVVLRERAEAFAVGSRGQIYHTVSSYGARGSANEIRVMEPSGSPGQNLKLEAGAEVKALASDGRGTLYLGVKAGGDAQIWVLPERASGEKAEPKAKLKPELPDELNGLFVGREAGTLYALCGDNWVVKLKTDGAVTQRVELPGDGQPKDGGIDGEGNLYVRRSSGPVVKVKPDGTVDPEWAKSAVAAHDTVRSVAVDSRGLVYVSASDQGIYLRAYDGTGELAFNVVADVLKYAPDRVAVTPKDWLYALDGQKVYVFRP